MLPHPTSLTIPSIYDDTVLDCRIYSPPDLLTTLLSEKITWRKKYAIVAHPYAPLGGCYDDPIVEIIASSLVDHGIFVGTFNFRGAGGSKGHTSWTAKPETEDYTSFVGLMVYFMHYLKLPDSVCSSPSSHWDEDEQYVLSPIPSQASPPSQSLASPLTGKRHAVGSTRILQDQSLLLLAGYSYGALVTTQLPALASIISLFHAPAQGTAASEIKLRAQELAKQQNDLFANLTEELKLKIAANTSKTPGVLLRGRSLRAKPTLSSRKASATASIRLGGEETDPDVRRASHDSHRRIPLPFEPERLRKSVDRIRSLGRRPDFRNLNASYQRKGSDSSRRSSSEGSCQSIEIFSPLELEVERSEYSEKVEDNVDVKDIKVSYLLISPLQGFVTKLATMWTKPARPKTKTTSSKDRDVNSEIEKKLTENETLAIFGDQDIFSNGKKLHLWADRLGSDLNSCFRYVEISGAGHFWHEHAVQMQENVLEFVSGL